MRKTDSIIRGKPRRSEMVGSTIYRALTEIMWKKFDMEVCISKVEVTSDLLNARIYLMEEASCKELMQELIYSRPANSEKPLSLKNMLRFELGKKLSIKRVPELFFFVDES